MKPDLRAFNPLRLLLGLALLLPLTVTAAELESPEPDSVQGGVGLIRGWVCEAQRITIRIDDGQEKEAGYGTGRGDTRAACGDANNGFGLTQNWNLLGEGSHRIRAWADGQLFADRHFSVVSGSSEFLTDTFAESVVTDFPQAPDYLILRWSQPDQNMRIAGRGSSQPTLGRGGAFPGEQSRGVTLPGLGEQRYFLYLPAGYSPERASPVLFLFHGAAGPGTAQREAQAVRGIWEAVADQANLILVSQMATGANGGWIPGNAAAILSAILEDLGAAYNLELSRLYLWGFSAGGHFVHALALQNTDTFAAYAVSAGALEALAGTNAPAQAARPIPLVISIGSRDSLYPFAAQDRQRFDNAGWTQGHDLFFQEFAGGHTYSADQSLRIWQPLGTRTLP